MELLGGADEHEAGADEERALEAMFVFGVALHDVLCIQGQL